MAKKGIGLLLAGGAALVLMSGSKKKRRTKSNGNGVYDREAHELGERIKEIERDEKKSSQGKTYTYDVAEYQAQLHRIGYGDYVGAVDGVLGSGTRQAILEFQRNINAFMDRRLLDDDGIWGPQTQKAADVAEEILPRTRYSRFPDYVSDTLAAREN